MNDNTKTEYIKLEVAQDVLLTNRELIIMGCPDCEDEGHNCDQMGCGSLDHVLLRVPLSKCSIGFTRKEI